MKSPAFLSFRGAMRRLAHTDPQPIRNQTSRDVHGCGMAAVGLTLQLLAVVITALAALTARFITRPTTMRILIAALFLVYVLLMFVPFLFLSGPERVTIRI